MTYFHKEARNVQSGPEVARWPPVGGVEGGLEHPPLQFNNSLTFKDPRSASGTTPPHQIPVLRGSARTWAAGCCLWSPGQRARSCRRALLLHPAAANWITFNKNSGRRNKTWISFFTSFFKIYIFIFKLKAQVRLMFNAQPCSSSLVAARCCPSTTRRSSSSSPAAATCTFP